MYREKYSNRIRHDLHQPQLLSRRLIYRIDSSYENVSAITLKLIDVFLEKDKNSKIIDNFVFKFLSNKVFSKHSLQDIKENIIKNRPENLLEKILNTIELDINSIDIKDSKSKNLKIIKFRLCRQH